MLWYCAFNWHSNTTREKVAQRILQQHEVGGNRPEQIRGWYNLAGGGAGFLLVETDDPRELTAFLQPYMDLVDWDVRAIYEISYDQQIESARQIAQQAG